MEHWYTNYSSQNIDLGSSENKSLSELQAEENFNSLWKQIIWCVLFGGIVIVATGGNVIVIWIVFTNRRMRSVTNYFIVNLSFADILVSTLNVIFSFIYMLRNHWPFGKFYCKVTQFVSVLSISASVFTLVAISMDRYTAILHPLQPRMSKLKTLLIIVCIWIFSIVLSSPMVIYSDSVNFVEEGGETRTVCSTIWPDGMPPESYQEYIYNVVFMILTYFLPIFAMIVAYSRIGKNLWGSEAIGEDSKVQINSRKSKKKVVKMLILVVVIFGVCWLPFHIYFIITSYLPHITRCNYVQDLYLGIYWLAMSNSMYNPMVYCWLNKRFRQGFQNAFSCCMPSKMYRPSDDVNKYYIKYTSTRRQACNSTSLMQRDRGTD